MILNLYGTKIGKAFETKPFHEIKNHGQHPDRDFQLKKTETLIVFRHVVSISSCLLPKDRKLHSHCLRW